VSARDGMQLTADAQRQRDEFEARYGDRGNCSCHLSPPCGSCLHPGNPNNQADDDSCWERESENVQGVNDAAAAHDGAEVHGVPPIDPAERERILREFAARLDAPAPDELFGRIAAVSKTAGPDIQSLVFTTLLRAALFCDDVRVEHPELDPAAVCRVAADCLLRAAVLCVHSAKKREGDAFDAFRFALVTMAMSEHWLEASGTAERELLNAYEPGELRRELEESGLVEPRAPAVAATEGVPS
jgi:hypothetical protein